MPEPTTDQVAVDDVTAFLDSDEVIEEPTIPASDAAESTPEEEWTPPEFVVIDGQRIPWEQAQAGFMMQADYTRKNQSLAEERKRVEQYATIMETWENRPELRPLIVQELAKEAGLQIGGGNVAPNAQAAPSGLIGQYNPNDATPEWEQRGYGSETELLIHRDSQLRMQEVSKTLGSLEQFIGAQQQEAARNLAASQAVQQLTGYGFNGVTPDAVKAAMIQTGLSDPEAAFLKANASKIAGLVSGRATAPPAANKPQAPTTGRGRTFDPMDPKLGADDVARLMANGFVPAEGG